MSWNKYYIIISNPDSIEENQLLSKLNLSNYKKVGSTSLYGTNKPQNLFIANYKDHFIISDEILPFALFMPHSEYELYDTYPSLIEVELIKLFPKSKFVVLIEDGTSCSYGFCIIENGIKIRMKNGGDGSIYNDMGEELQIEAEVYDQIMKEIEAEGEENMVEELGEDGFELHIDNESGFRVPNLIFKSIFGADFWEIDGDQIIFSEYKKP